ncbi:hypothetical protein B7463_g6270, partial [Scytalidium lignicola]
MPPTAPQKVMMAQFTAITGAPERIASRILKATNWKLDQACDSLRDHLSRAYHRYFTKSGRRSANKPSKSTMPPAKRRRTTASTTKSKAKSGHYFAQTGTGPITPQKDTTALVKLFDKYRDPQAEDTDTINVDGTMQYLTDIGVNLENAEILVALEIVQAPTLGEITKTGFVDGWKVLGNMDTIAKQKAYVAEQIKLFSTDLELFKRVYRHTFICSKEKGQRALALENALIYWELLFTPPGRPWISGSTNWLELWADFLKTKWTKSVNRDMWNQTFEFYRKTIDDESLSFWSEDAAWPSVIDDFVSYVKTKRTSESEHMETD